MKVAARFAAMTGYRPANTPHELAARLGIAPQAILKLDANENPYGPSPRARSALAQLELPQLYPDAAYTHLRAALSAFCGAPADLIQVGAGADELIDITLRALLEPGEAVLNLPPSFSMYPLAARLNRARLVEVPRRADFSLDLPAIQRAAREHQPKAILLCAPNNPDGGMPNAQEIEALLELPAVLILDEAYIEFSDDALGQSTSRIRQVAQRGNLAVLRTFSKWAGLAGLRVGYGAFPAWLAGVIANTRHPYNLNLAGEAAALASLEDLDWLKQHVNALRAGREELRRALQQLNGLEVLPSAGNFVLCRCASPQQAAALVDGLAERAILVRGLGADAPACLRLTVGKPQDNQRLLEAIQDLWR